jgi:hypothetical protein
LEVDGLVDDRDAHALLFEGDDERLALLVDLGYAVGGTVLDLLKHEVQGGSRVLDRRVALGGALDGTFQKTLSQDSQGILTTAPLS